MTTSSPLSFASASLQLTSAPKLSYIYTPIHSSTHRSYPISSIRMCGISALPEKKTGPKKIRRKISPSPSSEAQDLVRSIVRSISDKQPLLNTLNKYVQFIRTEHCFLLFEELGRSERWLQCLEVFRWMQKQRWYVADNGVYSKLISVMGKKGQSRMAMWLFSEMRNSGCKPDTSVYNALITAHLHSRDKAKALSKALSYFEKMKGMEHCKPSVVTYNILLRAFAQAKNVEQVNVLFSDLDESVISPDAFTFNGVMDAYGKVGLIREMELVLAKMKSKKIKPDIITFNLLIDAYGRKQEFEKMEQVFTSLLRSKEKPTLPTFNSMITNYGKARLREKADLTYQKMIGMGYKPSFITYECLIMMYGYCDRVSRAREIFDEMVETGREKKVSTLNAMLDVYCMNGLPLEADKLFESARASQMLPVDSTTYKLLYKAYTKADMKEMVEKLLVCMDKDGIVPNKRFFLDALGALGSSPASKRSTSRKEGVPKRTPAGKAQLGGARSVEKSSILAGKGDDEVLL